MNRIFLLTLLIGASCLAQPSCMVEQHSQSNKIGTVSGIASGFEKGKIYVTLSNGLRKYTTIAESDGRWALSFAELEKSSEILCWQNGSSFQAKLSIETQ